MKEYRVKILVEAAQWLDTDDARKAFTDWFSLHDMMFETRSAVIVLDDIEDGYVYVQEHEWVIIENCQHKCGLPDLHEGLCACPRKIAALVTAGVTGAWQVAEQTP